MKINLYCRVRQHKLGEWEYVSEDSCEQVQICRRKNCEYKNHRSFHHFGNWQYKSGESCEQVRICQRDGKEEYRLLHDYGDWTYVNSATCEQVRVCNRDAHIQKGINHNWVFSHTETRTDQSCPDCGGSGVIRPETAGLKFSDLPNEAFYPDEDLPICHCKSTNNIYICEQCRREK